MRYWEENKCKQRFCCQWPLIDYPGILVPLEKRKRKKKWIPNSQSITFLPINTYHQPYSQLGTLPTAAAFEMFMMVVLFSAFSQSSMESVLLSMTFNRLPWYFGSLREAEEKKKMDSQFPEHNLFADKHIPSALQPIGYTANGGCIWDVYDGRTFSAFFPKAVRTQ